LADLPFLGKKLLILGMGIPRVDKENRTLPDFKVDPLEGKLSRIFELDEEDTGLLIELCRVFLQPIFSRAEIYPDVEPTLEKLRDEGYRMAVISNSPWGSPAKLWHEEVERLGLTHWFEAIVFCSEAGWRKPARPVFDLALERMNASVEDGVFVGDDPRWDVVGPHNIGMKAILLDREGVLTDHNCPVIRGLGELVRLLGKSRTYPECS